MEGIKTVFEAILFIIVVGSILFLAYIAARYIAGKSGKAKKGRYIEIIETISLGADKKLHLVRVDKQFVLIASFGKNVEFLANIPLEGYENIANVEEKSEAFDFKSFFNKYLEIYRNLKNENFLFRNRTQNASDNNPEGYFKENLNRLREFNKDRVTKNDSDRDDKSNGR